MCGACASNRVGLCGLPTIGLRCSKFLILVAVSWSPLLMSNGRTGLYLLFTAVVATSEDFVKAC